MRIGILGGTFNPPHVGHLIAAQEAHLQLGLDRVILMPAGIPPHKQHREQDPGPEHRLAMCRRAIGADERFEVSSLEVDRPGPSFTVDTLEALHTKAPDNELYLIVGGDVAAGLPSWREPERVLSLARLAVAKRRGTARNGRRRGPRRSRGRRPGGILPHAPDRDLLDDAAPARAVQASRSPTSCPTRSRATSTNTVSTEDPHSDSTPEEIAQAIAAYASDRKALDIVQLDLRGMISYTDYFVICTGRTDRQAKAIHDAIHLGMKGDHAMLPARVEGGDARRTGS